MIVRWFKDRELKSNDFLSSIYALNAAFFSLKSINNENLEEYHVIINNDIRFKLNNHKIFEI